MSLKSFNSFMHPRNIYRNKPNYNKLAENYPEFAKIITHYDDGKPKIDFDDPKSLRLLTITLLAADFRLNVDLPFDRLIPAVPQRLNYLHWIEDLVSSIDGNISIIGIDLGTGSCCIFPLLGCRLNKHWSFIATEADEKSYKYALDNVKRNHLDSRINVIKVDSTSFLLPILSDTKDASFLICNPPFFDKPMVKEDEMMQVDKLKTRRSRISPSAEIETIYLGGEVEFVKKLIQESLQAKEKVKIFSVMLGHKKSLSIIKKEIYKLQDIKSVDVCEFCQGKTIRWGIAWTFFQNLKLASGIKRPRLNTKILVHEFPISLKWINLNSVYEEMQHLFRNVLAISFVRILHRSKCRVEFELRSNHNTWIHQRRKRRENKRKLNEAKTEEVVNITENIVCKGLKDLKLNLFANSINSLTCDLPSPSNKRKLDDDEIVDTEMNTEEYKKVKEEFSLVFPKDEEFFLLNCKCVIKKIEEVIILEMQTKEKCSDPETTCQLFQYLKNKFF